jgi:hypothetical protein
VGDASLTRRQREEALGWRSHIGNLTVDAHVGNERLVYQGHDRS